MSGQVFASASKPAISVTSAVVDVTRRNADYHPSLYGDRFLSLDNFADIPTDKNIEILKEAVKSMILCPLKTTSEKLDMIDVVQRLGLSYHFEEDIESVLQQIYQNTAVNHKDDSNDDLYNVALRFRLLRQQGYHVSCELFNKFKNNEGKFNESLANDVRGMLSLYEASFLSVPGEEILEEALTFTSYHLELMVTRDSIECPILLENVSHALKQPIQKGLVRIEARYFISLYQQDPSHISHLLNLAKLDFNILQKVHQEELSHIARWWKELDFATKLPFARDRIVECYFWILGLYYEPQYGFARRTLTKVIVMISVLDDIFDLYGTFEELELFTQAAERWHISAMDELPEYMTYFYKALLDVYGEIEENLAIEDGNLYRLKCAKDAMNRQIRAYYEEAKWLHTKHVPNMEEYMRVSLVSTAYGLLTMISFVTNGDIVTGGSLEWLVGNPKIVKSSEIICRLMDDIVSHEFEQKREHVPSAVECYMEQHGTTEEETVKVLREEISNAWKDINSECLYNHNNIPMPLLLTSLNMSRVMDVLYKDEDSYTHSHGHLKDLITSILIDPISD